MNILQPTVMTRRCAIKYTIPKLSALTCEDSIKLNFSANLQPLFRLLILNIIKFNARLYDEHEIQYGEVV